MPAYFTDLPSNANMHRSRESRNAVCVCANQSSCNKDLCMCVRGCILCVYVCVRECVKMTVGDIFISRKKVRTVNE